jgi:hypothetical protein
MMNLIGKSLALVHVGLSFCLMGLAAVMYLTGYDLGWKEPQRYYNDPPGKKDENLLTPSELDKAEAAMRKLANIREEELFQLGTAQVKLATVEPWLGKNHVRGIDVLAKLEGLDALGKSDIGKGTFEIDDLVFDPKNALVVEEDGPEVNGVKLGFPKMEQPLVKRGFVINKSYLAYLFELRSDSDDPEKRGLEEKISDEQGSLKKILTAEEAISRRLIGEMAPDGTPLRNKDGSIKLPGWHYLIELEIAQQKELKKEIEYLRPLWLKELVDAQLVVARRDLLLQRLHELNDHGYMKQSEFLSKQR